LQWSSSTRIVKGTTNEFEKLRNPTKIYHRRTAVSWIHFDFAYCEIIWWCFHHRKKPSMQLVLWRPPCSLIEDVCKPPEETESAALSSSGQERNLDVMEMEELSGATQAAAVQPCTIPPSM
jgi:hypothetical protein